MPKRCRRSSTNVGGWHRDRSPSRAAVCGGEDSEGSMIAEYQQQLRERFLSAPLMPPPPSWRPVFDRRTPIGGLQGIGFATDPQTGNDLVMVVSMDGHGLFDAATGEKV